MNSEYLLLTGALRVFNDFPKTQSSMYAIKHDTSHPSFDLLRNRYSLQEVARSGTDFSKAVNIMRWVYDNVQHSGGGGEVDIPRDPISLLDYCFKKGRMPGICCRHRAVVLTECCLAIGLTARMIHCLPFSPYDFESHVVSMVYIREMNKWVLFDQCNNAYFTDKSGAALSPLEARSQLALDEINISGGLQKDLDLYKQYMAKNLFYFKFWANNTFGTDLVENQITYHLAPRGFNVKDREIAYCEYAIKNCPADIRKGWEDALDKLRNQNIINVSNDEFLQV